MNLIKNKNDKMIFSYNTSFKTFMFKHFLSWNVLYKLNFTWPLLLKFSKIIMQMEDKKKILTDAEWIAVSCTPPPANVTILCDMTLLSYSGKTPCLCSVWKSTPPWPSRTSAVRTLEKPAGHASTVSCQTQTTPQNQATMPLKSQRSLDSRLIQIPARDRK